jgi:hypothetical protein
MDGQHKNSPCNEKLETRRVEDALRMAEVERIKMMYSQSIKGKLYSCVTNEFIFS